MRIARTLAAGLATIAANGCASLHTKALATDGRLESQL
jgi:hypothetical protein